MRMRSKLLLTTVAIVALVSVVAMREFRIRWRVQFIAMKLVGKTPYLSWKETVQLVLSKGSQVPTGGMPAKPSPKLVASNASDASVQAGREFFLHQCSTCHGPDARGGTGPDLTRGQFQHGDSDSALFRTITQGVPNTEMLPRNIPPETVGQLIAFLRSATAANVAGAAGSPGQPLTRLASATPFNVTPEQLASAGRDSAEWLMYSGSYDGQRHSRLSQISRDNVARLRLKWMFQFPIHSVHSAETTPLVVGNTMFVTLPPNNLWALDARTGEVRWTWSGPTPATIKASNHQNRGVAISGNTVLLGTMDAHLVALNAQTGKLIWDVKVADANDAYSITSAPLVVRDRVIVGVAGGEYAIRGFLDAYSVTTGERAWRFYTVPAPGEPGHETWDSGDSWKEGGGPTWLTGSYDPALDLVYWGVGNPGPDFLGDIRPGTNLYTCSVIALDARTGRLRWHYQFTPHDVHDWDAAQIPVLADALYQGKPRKLMYWANRNAFYYVLDRETGQYLHAQPFAQQTWAVGIDSTGVPIVKPGTDPTTDGTLVAPALHGATNWWSPSYDSASNTMYVPTMEGPGIFTKGAPLRSLDGTYRGSAGVDLPGEPSAASVRALDASTGTLRWEYHFPPRRGGPVMGGLLSTNGGLVLGGDQFYLMALDSQNGHELWRFMVGAEISAAPVTYLSDGRQQVTIAAGRAILTFSLDGQ